MLDRSPDEMGSHGNDVDEEGDSDSDHGDGENGETTDGERIIYPWMKKIHVAGVGKCLEIYYVYMYSFEQNVPEIPNRKSILQITAHLAFGQCPKIFVIPV